MRRRVLVVLEAGTAYPSGYVRGLLYQEQWTAAGYDVRYMSRLSPPLVRFLDSPPRWARPLMVAGLEPALASLSRWIGNAREASIVRAARSSDVVYLVKAVSHSLVQRIRRASRARLVLDLVDALWLPRYRVSRLEETLRMVDAVTTDNEQTAGYLRTFQPNCTIVPDSPQIEWFDRQRAARVREEGHACVIGWVGGPGTTFNLFVVWEALERLFAKHDHLELRLLGADAHALPKFERVRWTLAPRYTQQEMIREVLQMDIGLFPLQDVESCRVRGVLKAAVYMAGGAAVVASPVGQTPELVVHGRTGLLATTTDEWEAALDRLVADADERRRLANSAMAELRKRLTVEGIFAILRQALDPREGSEAHI